MLEETEQCFDVFTHRLHLPDNHSCVFRAGGEFGAVVGELAEPDFIAVLCEDLLCVTGKLFPANTSADDACYISEDGGVH